MLIARALELGADIRWQHKVISVQPQADHARLTVETPDGLFEIEADWLVVADGARSPIRRQLGLDIEGRIFMGRFLIADVIMKADYPAERWFWFDPPFHPGQSVLLHKQADKVWRIDFQLGWDAAPEVEKQPEKVIPRIQAMLGDDFYEALIETHHDLGDEQSERVNARLILLLANHIGDLGVLRQALRLARAGD